MAETVYFDPNLPELLWHRPRALERDGEKAGIYRLARLTTTTRISAMGRARALFFLSCGTVWGALAVEVCSGLQLVTNSPGFRLAPTVLVYKNLTSFGRTP